MLEDPFEAVRWPIADMQKKLVAIGELEGRE
jgi:hypothetical protein